jgi:hypothetical protein
MKHKVWMEGYAVSGNSEGARLLGEFEAPTFAEACAMAAAASGMVRDFDRQRLSVWGCRLFDNEDDARRAFG